MNQEGTMRPSNTPAAESLGDHTVPATTCDHRCVDATVEDQHNDSEYELDPPRESIGVEDAHHVVRDEAARVSRLAGSMAEPDLERGQRTGPSEELDQDSPDRRRHVDPRDLWPAQDEHATRHHEQEKGEVN